MNTLVESWKHFVRLLLCPESLVSSGQEPNEEWQRHQPFGCYQSADYGGGSREQAWLGAAEQALTGPSNCVEGTSGNCFPLERYFTLDFGCRGMARDVEFARSVLKRVWKKHQDRKPLVCVTQYQQVANPLQKLVAVNHDRYILVNVSPYIVNVWVAPGFEVALPPVSATVEKLATLLTYRIPIEGDERPWLVLFAGNVSTHGVFRFHSQLAEVVSGGWPRDYLLSINIGSPRPDAERAFIV